MTVLKRFFTPAAVSIVATVLLAACGGTDEQEAPAAPETTEESASDFNDSDISFAQMMIPHHEQATTMAELAQDRAGEEVRDLATEIENAQGPEIEEMTALLDSWGQEPSGDGEHEGMTGMMSEEQMDELEQAEGEAFDTMFLEMMIEHHEGAVEMAQTEIDEGVNPEAQELAQEIIDTQQAETEQMNEMLGAEDGDNGDDGGESPSSEGHDGH